ncbi:hypothetical protein GEOBRER4_n2674 [Citrifermentans bremense]|uniref:Type II toxin-antitoxin system RelE/ParE family toxin n=1 Tax=Citrifermentans bremense TaxID=60035 RepID=A0A6S6M8S2_9BACT|nr:hypothetical protein [Citrifermentans bremense]BCG47825.1 hypothetical protein GEOBRER4_n2674 [Citrifermentans bremense]
MAGYNVLLRESVRKDLDSIPKNDLRRIVARIGNLPTTRGRSAVKS